MQDPTSERPGEALLCLLLGPRLRDLIGRLDSTLRTRPARGRFLVVGLASLVIAIVMAGFSIDDAYGLPKALLYFAAVAALFRLAPLPAPKAPPRIGG